MSNFTSAEIEYLPDFMPDILRIIPTYIVSMGVDGAFQAEDGTVIYNGIK